jgi:hypothetical protein
MRSSFDTSVGAVDILFDEPSGVVSIYRLGPDGRPVAAALETIDYADLARVLIFEADVPPKEAEQIATSVSEALYGPGESGGRRSQRPWRAIALRAACVGVLAASVWTIANALL